MEGRTTTVERRHPKKKTPFGVFISMGRGKDSVQKLTKCQVLNGGENHHGGKKTPPKKKTPFGVFISMGRGGFEPP